MRLLRFFTLLCASCLAAHAATATYNISFTASGQLAASGSFALTFDPTLNYATDTTAGLTVNNLSFASGPSGFYYDTGNSGTLILGGLLNGIDSVSAGTNDYFVELYNVQTSPKLAVFYDAMQGQPGVVSEYTGTASVTQVATTPEPSSFVLLATGLLGAGAALRRRLVYSPLKIW